MAARAAASRSANVSRSARDKPEPATVLRELRAEHAERAAILLDRELRVLARRRLRCSLWPPRSTPARSRGGPESCAAARRAARTLGRAVARTAPRRCSSTGPIATSAGPSGTSARRAAAYRACEIGAERGAQLCRVDARELGEPPVRLLRARSPRPLRRARSAGRRICSSRSRAPSQAKAASNDRRSRRRTRG